MIDVDDCLKDAPFVAILRGVKPDEIIDHAEAITQAGWRILEVPLNSPEPLKSISKIAGMKDTLVGAGTVLTVDDVKAVHDAGGRLIVSPNTDTKVIERALALNMVVMPGFFTASEAFAAYQAGARYLKLFPADSVGPSYLKALGAVMPKDARLIAVGGLTPANMHEFHAAGSAAYGIGSQLYKPGMTPAQSGKNAEAFMAAFRSIGANF